MPGWVVVVDSGPITQRIFNLGKTHLGFRWWLSLGEYTKVSVPATIIQSRPPSNALWNKRTKVALKKEEVQYPPHPGTHSLQGHVSGRPFDPNSPRFSISNH